MTSNEKLDIDRVVFIGRTEMEYRRMFDIDDILLRKGPILDCAAGPSSFAATGSRAGLDVTACDPCYDLPAERLAHKGAEDIEHVFDRFDEVAHLYIWSHYRDKNEVIALRRRALADFLGDFSLGRDQGRYLPATLPRLPFAERSFTLVLCSHFLFLYGDRLSREFHLAALRELLRVSAAEVRVFPLQGLDARPYPEMAGLLDTLRAEGTGVEILDVSFEFQKGSHQMLRLRRVEK